MRKNPKSFETALTSVIPLKCDYSQSSVTKWSDQR